MGKEERSRNDRAAPSIDPRQASSHGSAPMATPSASLRPPSAAVDDRPQPVAIRGKQADAAIRPTLAAIRPPIDDRPPFAPPRPACRMGRGAGRYEERGEPMSR